MVEFLLWVCHLTVQICKRVWNFNSMSMKPCEQYSSLRFDPGLGPYILPFEMHFFICQNNLWLFFFFFFGVAVHNYTRGLKRACWGRRQVGGSGGRKSPTTLHSHGDATTTASDFITHGWSPNLAVSSDTGGVVRQTPSCPGLRCNRQPL